jgi:hypothetical protein
MTEFIQVVSKDELIAVIDGVDQACASRNGESWIVWPCKDFSQITTHATTKEALKSLKDVARREAGGGL